MSYFQATSKTRIIHMALALIIGLLSFGLLHTLSRVEKNAYIYKEQQETAHYGESLRAGVDRELNSLLFISNGLASYLTVYKDELDPKKINAILKDLWSRAKLVKNLGIAIGYRLTYVYPVKGNEKIIGMDFHDLHSQWKKVQMAIESRQGLLDGPLDLYQGGNGIVYRYPIYIDNEYWGILSTVINTQPFLEAAFEKNLNTDYVFAIRTDDKKVFYGDPDLFNHKSAVLISSNLPNGKWEWAIEKQNAIRPGYFYMLDILTVVISLLTAGGVYYYIHERYSLSREALIDSLTNLPNRRYLDRKLLESAVDTERNNQLMSVMLIDLDYFKNVNDTRGHAFGDAALIRVSEIIQSKIRGTDILSRIGGDEFVLLLNHLKSPQDAEIIAEKIISSFTDPQLILGIPTKLSVSIGMATTVKDEKINIKHLLKHADEALYLAKGEGRDRYKIYQS